MSRKIKRRNPDLNEFNTQLSKEMKKLKKDLGANNIRQNYKGTGSQAHRRQLWVHLPNNGCIDIWIDSGFVQLGGVVANRPGGGGGYPNPRNIPYGDKTPQQVYMEVLASLTAWCNPAINPLELKTQRYYSSSDVAEMLRIVRERGLTIEDLQREIAKTDGRSPRGLAVRSVMQEAIHYLKSGRPYGRNPIPYVSAEAVGAEDIHYNYPVIQELAKAIYFPGLDQYSLEKAVKVGLQSYAKTADFELAKIKANESLQKRNPAAQVDLGEHGLSYKSQKIEFDDCKCGHPQEEHSFSAANRWCSHEKANGKLCACKSYRPAQGGYKYRAKDFPLLTNPRKRRPGEFPCNCKAYKFPHREGGGKCLHGGPLMEEQDQGECGSCGGSGGGEGYWRCPACRGSGQRPRPKFERDEPDEPFDDPDAWQGAQDRYERGLRNPKDGPIEGRCPQCGDKAILIESPYFDDLVCRGCHEDERVILEKQDNYEGFDHRRNPEDIDIAQFISGVDDLNTSQLADDEAMPLVWQNPDDIDDEEDLPEVCRICQEPICLACGSHPAIGFKMIGTLCEHCHADQNNPEAQRCEECGAVKLYNKKYPEGVCACNSENEDCP